LAEATPSATKPFLATAKPTVVDRKRSLFAIVASLVLLAAIAPFATVPLPRFEAFIPSYESALTIVDLLTAVLLFSQFTILRRWSLLMLASGYLLNTFLIAAHALSFPGVVSAVGLFGDSQTTAWLYVFWHLAFPILVAAYARIADSPVDRVAPTLSTRWSIAAAFMSTILVAIVLIVAASKGAAWLPVIVVNGDYRHLVTKGVSPLILLTSCVAIALMWRRRRRSILDLWVFTLLWVWICDVSLSAVVSSARFHLGWYGGRAFGLFATSTLLVAFLFELDRLYLRLARAVADVEARNRELVRSRGELVRAQRLEALGQMTGSIAHDFNNLLTAIGGSLEMIARRPGDTERVARMTENARKTTERGAQLIRRLMSTTRKHELRPELLDVRQTLEEFAAIASGVLGPAHRLHFDLDDSGMISADAAEFQAALLNLLTNARDAMPDGGEIRVSTKTIAADEADAEPQVEIAVVDTGTGMTAEVQARLFEPFFTTKSLGLGTGLGLSQVHGFAQGAGGEVRVDSAPGRGSVFRLRLPRVSAKPEQDAIAPSALPKLASFVRVLLVEDDDDVRTATSDRLEDLGYVVVTASSGDEAFEMLTSGLAVDIVFSDIVMPGQLDGVQLATAVRPRRPELKWLLTSGYTGGAFDRVDVPKDFQFLAKPYNQKDLAEKLVATAAA